MRCHSHRKPISCTGRTTFHIDVETCRPSVFHIDLESVLRGESSSMGDFGLPVISVHKRLSQSPFSCTRGFPQWFIASAASGGKDAWNRRSFSLMEPGDTDVKDYTNGKSVFSGMHLIPSAKCDDGIAWVVKNEDTMDMLWESFNEVQIQYTCEKGDAMKAQDVLTEKAKIQEKENMITMTCPVRDIEPGRGKIANQSKPNFLAMVKSLKRIMSIQRSRRANKEAVKGNGLCPKPKNVKL